MLAAVTPARTHPLAKRMLKVKLDATVRVGNDALYTVPPEFLGLLRSIR